MPVTPIDAGVVALLAWGGRLGYRRGFGETLWPMIRALLVLGIGAAACVPFGAKIHTLSRLPLVPSNLLAYALIAVGVILLIDFLRRRLGERVSAAAPWGGGDPYLGLAAGIVAWAAAILVVLALLFPLKTAVRDWDPARMSGDEAVGSLFQVILGSVRRITLEESWTGRATQEHLGCLLVADGK